MKEFMLSAGGLTKNPLGVVGLFICLVYGLACLVFLINGRNLHCGESWMLVSFVAIFPCIVLIVFYRLVTRHNKKLYAPSDYKDERNFISMMSDDGVSTRLNEEVAKIPSLLSIKENASDENKHNPSITKQKKRTNYLASLDLKKVKRPEHADAERLAFLALEKKIGKPFVKYVSFSVAGKNLEFDGYLDQDGEMHVVDVIYIDHPVNIDDYVDALVKKSIPVFSRDNASLSSKKFVWIGIVYPFTKDELRSSGTTGLPPPHLYNYGLGNLHINRQFLSLDELKQTYD